MTTYERNLTDFTFNTLHNVEAASRAVLTSIPEFLGVASHIISLLLLLPLPLLHVGKHLDRRRQVLQGNQILCSNKATTPNTRKTINLFFRGVRLKMKRLKS